MKQRILSLLIAIAMILAFIPGTAFAAEAEPVFPGEVSRHLTDVKMYDKYGNLMGEREFNYDGDLLTEVVNKHYGTYATEIHTYLTYDTAGRLHSVITGQPEDRYVDPEINPGKSTGVKYTYNDAGQLIFSQSWEGGYGEITYEYDAAGNLIRTVESYDPGELITEYTYDAEGVLIRIVKGWEDEEPEIIDYSDDSQEQASDSEEPEDSAWIFFQQYPVTFRGYQDGDDGNSSGELELWLEDIHGYGIQYYHSYGYNEAQLYTDAQGLPAKIVKRECYPDEVETYVFYYDGVAAEVVGEEPEPTMPEAEEPATEPVPEDTEPVPEDTEPIPEPADAPHSPAGNAFRKKVGAVMILSGSAVGSVCLVLLWILLRKR